MPLELPYHLRAAGRIQDSDSRLADLRTRLPAGRYEPYEELIRLGQLPAAGVPPGALQALLGEPLRAGLPPPRLEQEGGSVEVGPMITSFDRDQPVDTEMVQHEDFFLRLVPGIRLSVLQGEGTLELPYEPEAGWEDPNTLAFNLPVLSVLAGYSVAEGLILHGAVGGSPLGGALDSGHYEVAMLDAFVGGGATYYLEPTNLYVTATASFASMWFWVMGVEASQSDETVFYDAQGLELKLAVGYEWWSKTALRSGPGLGLTQAWLSGGGIDFRRTGVEAYYGLTFD